MVDIILAIFLSLLAVIGLLLNLYLVTALIVAKQVHTLCVLILLSMS